MKYFPLTVEPPGEEVTLLTCYTDHLLLKAYLHLKEAAYLHFKDKFVKCKYDLFYEMFHISASMCQVIRNLLKYQSEVFFFEMRFMGLKYRNGSISLRFTALDVK